MNYLKKICIFKEIGSGYAFNGKSLNGMLKCELINDSLTLYLSVGPLATPKIGEYYLVIGNKEFECYKIDCGETVIKPQTKSLDLSLPFCAGIVLSEQNKLICYTCTPDYRGGQEEIVEFFTIRQSTLVQEEKIIEEQIEQSILNEYTDDVVACDNYYENEDVDLKNLSIKENSYVYQASQNEDVNKQNFQQEKTVQTQNHICEDDFGEDSQQCFTAMEDVENVLKTFPRFSELERAVYGSVWVSIPLEQGEYYFGKTQIGEEKYLCYAVRGKKHDCPEQLKELACFVPCAPYKPDEGFFIMFQDAEKGTVIKK